MDDISREYAILFNGVTDVIQQAEALVRQMKLLQQRAEEAYICAAPSEEGAAEGGETAAPEQGGPAEG